MKRYVIAASLIAAPLSAAVISSSEHGFAVSRKISVTATPDQVFAALGQPGRWWSSAHTYSGDSRNMRLALRVGGCFCEAIPKDKGHVEHGRVIFVQPGKQLRLSAAFGPLQAEGVTGTVTWSLVAKEGGSEISQDYVVGGFMRASPKTLAPLVDQVMGEQLEGLVRYVESLPKKLP